MSVEKKNGKSEKSEKSDERRFEVLDMRRLELMQERIKTAALQIEALQKAGRIDELEASLKERQAQIDILQQQLRSHARDKQLASLVKMLTHEQDLYKELQKELGARYEIVDWGKISYDDETGTIRTLP